MNLIEILNKIKIQKIELILNDMNKINYYESEIILPLTLEQLIKVLEDKDIQDILKPKFNVILIYLEYPNIKITNELIEIINNNKVGEKIQEEVEMEYFINKKKKKQKIKVEYFKDLVKSFIDKDDFLIILNSFNKENLIKCILNLLEILEKIKEVNS